MSGFDFHRDPDSSVQSLQFFSRALIDFIKLLINKS